MLVPTQLVAHEVLARIGDATMAIRPRGAETKTTPGQPSCWTGSPRRQVKCSRTAGRSTWTSTGHRHCSTMSEPVGAGRRASCTTRRTGIARWASCCWRSCAATRYCWRRRMMNHWRRTIGCCSSASRRIGGRWTRCSACRRLPNMYSAGAGSGSPGCGARWSTAETLAR